jgi:hypothetical protein
VFLLDDVPTRLLDVNVPVGHYLGFATGPSITFGITNSVSYAWR